MCLNIRLVLVAIVFSYSLTCPASSAPYVFCQGSDKITFDPFRDFDGDYFRLSYLTLLAKPFISTDRERDGVLKSWQFSPDGKTMVGRVSPEAKWLDGTPISPREAAYSIAKAISFRHIGLKVIVPGFSNTRVADWHKKHYESIKILDKSTFQISFESDIKLLGGTIKEALSQLAMHNYIWPARIDSPNYKPSMFDLVSYYPIWKKGGKVFFSAFHHSIELQTRNKCDYSRVSFMKGVDYKLADLSNFTKAIGSIHFGVKGFVNMSKPFWRAKGHREDLIGLIRHSAKTINGYSKTDAMQFILPGEPGHTKIKAWPNKAGAKLAFKKIIIATDRRLDANHRLKTGIDSTAEKAGLSTEWRVLGSHRDTDQKVGEYDVYITGGSIVQGRQTWIQDTFRDKAMEHIWEHSGALGQTLKTISQNSSSTIPVKPNLLREFEITARSQLVIFPIYRSAIIAYSRRKSKLRLGFTSSNIPIFRKTEQ